MSKNISIRSIDLKIIIGSAMLSAVVVSFSIIAFPKIFNIYGFKTTCGVFFFPIGFSICDLIGYLKGREIAVFVFKMTIALDVLFSLMGILLYYIPPDASYHNQSMYYYIFLEHGIWLSLFAALGVYFSQKLNIALFFSKRISKFVFPARSSLSSMPADLVIAVFSIVPSFSTEANLSTELHWALNSALAKCAMSIIYAFVCYILIKIHYHVYTRRSDTSSQII